MLRRGVAAYEGGRYAEAARPLRIAAFGAVDSIEHYQTAQIYLALTFDQLKNEASARDAAARVVAAQRVEARYRGLSLPAAVREAFDALATKLLTETEVGWLTRAATNPPQAQRPAAPPPTSSPPAVTQTKPVPAPTPTTTTTKPAQPAPAPEKKPQPQAPTTKPTTPATTTATAAPKRVDVPARLAAADRALASAQLAEARRIYLELLTAGSLQHAEALRVAEGLYRARDFAGALRAFGVVGQLRAGEEPYNYYIAVARYETRDYSGAKRALAAALPFIELTPDVARYRDKIEAAAR